MVILHTPDAAAVQGVTRYSRDLATALEVIGEPVQRLQLRPWEIKAGRRSVGGFASMRMQAALRPLRKRDVLHSTFHMVAHPRCDVATVHDLFPQTMAPELGITGPEVRALDRGLARLARRKVHLVAVSDATKAALQGRQPGLDAARLHVVAPGVSEVFRPAEPDKPLHPSYQDRDAFHVLCVADLNPRKRFDWVLEASKMVGDARLRIVHAGPRRVRRPAWREQWQREHLLEGEVQGVRRLGPVKDDELLALYQGADLLVLPSLDEGFGFPPLEALACGTPVAVTDIPVFHETMGSKAKFFEGPRDLAELFMAYLDRGRPSMSERAARHAWIRQTYDWNQVAARMKALYATARERLA